MSSGFGHAKFSAEEFNSIPTAYGNYDEDGGGDDFMFVEDRGDVDFSGYDSAVLASKNKRWFGKMKSSHWEQHRWTPAFEHKEKEISEPVNASAAGLDGWGEVHSSWVRSKSSEIVAGGTVNGDFKILFTAVESNSQILVKGAFEMQTYRKMLGLIRFLRIASVLKTTQYLVVQSLVNSHSTAKKYARL